jgi:cytidyltransferase-like protein
MGGAAGHMAHPYDLQDVETGTDLLNFFERAKSYVEKKGAASVKIDGVNVSFKVVGEPGNKEFAVDRGSLKWIDIEGITIDKINMRFPEGHGMRRAIGTLLAILNKALPKIESELEALGLYNDPTKFLNTEYVEGKTNVTKYDKNFLAIHGLNQFYHKIHSRTGRERPGLDRPEGLKSPSVEVPYDSRIMESLIKKLNSVAEEYGFEVYGSVPTEKLVDIALDKALKEPVSFLISADREITKTLGEWLQEVTNPRYAVVKRKDGKKTHALHKQLYLDLLNKTVPIVDLVEEENAEDALSGAIIMHATRLLGNEILRGLTSPMGDVMNHEGIVLRDENVFGPQPVKITGEFIVGNLTGGFGGLEEEMDEDLKNVIALVPGAFKPPHQGHAEMVEQYAVEADKVIVLISKPVKSARKLANGRAITAEDSASIWKILTKHLPNVDIEISGHASPVTATYEFVSEEGPLEPGTEVILGVCTKGKDIERFRGIEKYAKSDIELRPLSNCAVSPVEHSSEYMELLNMSPLKNDMPSVLDSAKDPSNFHASDMRYLLGKATEDEEALELLEDFVGGPHNVVQILSILGIDTGLNEPLGETSSMGGGAIEGAPLGLSIQDRKRKRKKSIYYEPELYKEVLELIMSRGILK